MNCLLLNPFLWIIYVLRHFGKSCTVLFQAMPFQYALGSLLWYFIKMSNLYKTFQLSLWYLLTIGLLPVFSLRWSLPSALGCTPEQLDSGKTQDHHAGGRYRLTPSMAWALIRRTWYPHEQPPGGFHVSS